MEIEAGLRQFNWKQKMVFALVLGCLHAFLLWLIDQFVDNDFQTPLGLVFQGVFFGLFMGFGMPYLMKKFPKTFTSDLGKNITPTIDEDEAIEVSGPANLFRGVEGVGGKLFLSNKNVIFKSHKLNVQTGQTTIPFKDIVDLKTRKSGYIFNNGLRIITNEKNYDLVVGKRDIWIEQIRARM
ncbi:MAG: GRAM domain-containing protein [Nonlabens sp.]